MAKDSSGPIGRTPSPGRALLDEAWARGNEAPFWTIDWQVAGQRVRVEGIGSAVRSFLTPPCAHLEVQTSDEPPAWTVRAWDAQEGPGMPGLPTDLTGTTWTHGRIRELSDGGLVTVWEPGFRTVTMVDPPTRRALFVAADATALPYHEAAAPLRALWHAALGPASIQLIHGAAVSRGENGLLLTAPGGQGKSTTALRALAAGWGYLSDDYVLVDTSGTVPRLWTLYNTAKMVPKSLPWFGALPAPLRNPTPREGEKAVLLLHPSAATSLRPGAVLRAIVVPSIGLEQTTLWRRSTAGAAWRALVPDTLRGVAGAGPELILALQTVAQAAPAYELKLGADPAGVVRALEEILRDRDA